MGYYDESKRKYVNRYINTAGLRNTMPPEPENALLIAELTHRIEKIRSNLCEECQELLQKHFHDVLRLIAGLEE